jgi:hypothetical protein
MRISTISSGLDLIMTCLSLSWLLTMDGFNYVYKQKIFPTMLYVFRYVNNCNIRLLNEVIHKKTYQRMHFSYINRKSSEL